MGKVDLAKLVGVSGYVTCDYCKGKRRVPGGPYKDLYGEVIDCPNCDGRGMERVFLDLEQFAALVTIVLKKTKSRSRGRKRSQRQVRDVRRSTRRS